MKCALKPLMCRVSTEKRPYKTWSTKRLTVSNISDVTMSDCSGGDMLSKYTGGDSDQ